MYRPEGVEQHFNRRRNNLAALKSLLCEQRGVKPLELVQYRYMRLLILVIHSEQGVGGNLPMSVTAQEMLQKEKGTKVNWKRYIYLVLGPIHGHIPHFRVVPGH